MVTTTMEALPVEEAKLNVVRAYLGSKFAGATIDEKYDFDRGAQTFRIRIGKDLLLLKIGENFLSDNNEAQVRAHLENWNVANILRENKEFGIFVGNNAPIAFSRFT
jgi:hypothetical protein